VSFGESGDKRGGHRGLNQTTAVARFGQGGGEILMETTGGNQSRRKELSEEGVIPPNDDKGVEVGKGGKILLKAGQFSLGKKVLVLTGSGGKKTALKMDESGWRKPWSRKDREWDKSFGRKTVKRTRALGKWERGEGFIGGCLKRATTLQGTEKLKKEHPSGHLAAG